MLCYILRIWLQFSMLFACLCNTYLIYNNNKTTVNSFEFLFQTNDVGKLFQLMKCYCIANNIYFYILVCWYREAESTIIRVKNHWNRNEFFVLFCFVSFLVHLITETDASVYKLVSGEMSLYRNLLSIVYFSFFFCSLNF